jgi:hypothetical protein
VSILVYSRGLLHLNRRNNLLITIKNICRA